MDIKLIGSITGTENGVTAKWPEGKTFTDRDGKKIPTDILLLLKAKSPLVQEIVPQMATGVSTGVSDEQLNKLLEEIEAFSKNTVALMEQNAELEQKIKDLLSEIQRLKDREIELLKALDQSKVLENSLKERNATLENTISAFNNGTNEPETAAAAEGDIKCAICGKPAKSNAGLAAHMRTAHPVDSSKPEA
jgi:DNA repair exonuclease SbcCD ATPase subunit